MADGTHIKKLDMRFQAYKPSMGETETGRFTGLTEQPVWTNG